MPIYEYECQKCGHLFEDLVIGSRKETPQCPKCGKIEVHRRPSTFCGGAAHGTADAAAGCAPGGSGFT
ncbi:MAG: FmdB family zinc ribbon protein [Thermodesulfobacteriota bacterium]